MSTQLAKQKKTDFKPRNDDLSFARVNTEPCVACCEVLERIRDAAKQNLSGKNLECFLTELGVAFHGFVCLLSFISDLLADAMLPSVQPASRSPQKVPSKRHRRADACEVRSIYGVMAHC